MQSLVDTRIDTPDWAAADLAALADAAAEATFFVLGIDADGAEISLLGCDDAAIAMLNADHRGKAQPTNVLSWPAADLAAAEPGARPRLPDAEGPFGMELGDIAIAYGTCAREAAEAGIPLSAHVSHLLVHGLLHLLGYDHGGDSDAALMQACEIAILERMGLPDPYLGGAATGPQELDQDHERRRRVV